MVHATSLMHDSKVKDKSHSHKSNNSSNNNSSNNNNIGPNKSRSKGRHSTNDANQTSAMSNLTPYSLIDDDHIDDQDAINVGNLIIDLESDLEKEKIENEQANAKSSTCTTTTNANNAPSSSTVTKASSSTQSICNPSSTPTGKSHSSKSNKQLAVSNNNNINNNSDMNSQHIVESNGNIENNGHHGSSRTVFKTSSDERGELKLRITRETKPGKSEHKIITSPNQKSPTCSSSDPHFIGPTTIGNDNDCDESMLHHSVTPILTQSSSISSTKECGTSTSIGTITEPDCLGPCEPGTSVTLEGIVWQETDGGILVVNITWRGKTYVGALLDCTRHDWAPPRLCDSPASDIDSKTHKVVRAKRIVTRSNGIGIDEKNLLQTTGKLRNGKGRRILTSTDLQPCTKRQKESEKTGDNASEANSETQSVQTPITDRGPNSSSEFNPAAVDKDAGPHSPTLIGCKEPNCSKKFRNENGLMYHQAHAHGSDSEGQGTMPKEGSRGKNDDESTKITSMEVDDRPNLDPEPPITHEDKLTREEPQLSNTPPPRKATVVKASDQTQWTPNDDRMPLADQRNAAQRIVPDHERRNSSNLDHTRRSPDPPRHQSEPPAHASNLMPPQIQPQQHHQLHQAYALGPSHHPHSIGTHPSSKSNSSGTKNSNQPGHGNPNPASTSDEGMKPSGTSTGPPPAPHQTNYYFNSALLANSLNPYGLSPYLGKPSPLPLYDSLMPQTSSANAFLSRFMSNIRGVPPPPDSPSRLLSPSMSKTVPPFSPFRPELVGSPLGLPPLGPGGLPQPGPPPPPPIPPNSMANHLAPNMSPLSNLPPPPIPGGSPHLRMPSQGDPTLIPPLAPHHSLMPPGSLNPTALGLPLGPPTSMSHMMGPGGPQMPSLVDEALAKQFPRRFN